MKVHTDLLVAIGIRTPNGRVGSTLLMHLLGTSDSIAFDREPPYETRHLTYLMSLADMINPMPESVEQMRNAWHILQLLRSTMCDLGDLQRRVSLGLWEAFSDAVHEHSPGSRYYAEKIPLDGFDTLDAAGIPRRTIELVRDPRDMWASIKAFDAKRGHAGFGREKWQSDQEYLFATVATLRKILPSFGLDHDDHSVLVRYEDLVTDMPAVADRLSAWLGVELDVDAANTDRPELVDHRTTSSAAASIGRWRTDLDPVEAAYMTQRLAPELQRLGYDTEV